MLQRRLCLAWTVVHKRDARSRAMPGVSGTWVVAAVLLPPARSSWRQRRLMLLRLALTIMPLLSFARGPDAVNGGMSQGYSLEKLRS